MKKTTLLLLFSFLFLTSCGGSKKDKTGKESITGKWKLVETLADPGDGSGTFQPVESEKTIEFRDDGTFVVYNGYLCPPAEQSGPSTGTYSLSELTISPKNCDTTITFERSDGMLILRFPCIEPCGEKYAKIE